MDDEPFDDLLDGVGMLEDSSQESLTHAAANMWTIIESSDDEDDAAQMHSYETSQTSAVNGKGSAGKLRDPDDIDAGSVINSRSDGTDTTHGVSSPQALAIDKIEAVFEEIADALLNERDNLSIKLKMRSALSQHLLIPQAGLPQTRERKISFPGKTAAEAWRFSVVLRILEMMHEALHASVVLTKRDMYYRDPALFGRQAVVDRYVDNIALTFGVPRSMLNVTAAAKGLVAGAFTICRRDGSAVSGCSDRDGMLVPTQRDMLSVDVSAVRWILVVEKEATFRSISASSFWSTISTSGIIITGKGYPDIATRALLRFLSTSSPQNGFCAPPVYGLVDFDPDGLAILSTYRHGSFALAHENGALKVPSVKWLGLQSTHIAELAITGDDVHAAQGLLTLTARDRKKARKMLQHEVSAKCQETRTTEHGENLEAHLRVELQTMLMLNVKAELQLLDTTSGSLCALLERELGGA